MYKQFFYVMMLAAIASLAGCNSDSSRSGDGDDGADSSITNPEPTPDPDPEPIPEVLLEEDFEALTEGKLPEGWVAMSGTEDMFYTSNGSLFVDGRGDNYNPVSLKLPETLQEKSNYRIDVVFTIQEANTETRWVGFQYRVGMSVEPYYQMAIRQKATAENGTEHALRNQGEWAVVDKQRYSETIAPDQLYTATIVVHGDRVQHFMNGELMQDSELDSQFSQGGVAFQAAGSLLRVDEVTVTEQLTALPPLSPMADVAEPETGASMAPSIALAAPTLSELAREPSFPIFLQLDDQLMLTTEDGGSLGYLDSLVENEQFKALPMLYVTSQAAVDALAPVVEKHQLVDLTLVSDSPELLRDARVKMPMIRAAMDFTGAGLTAAPTDLLSITQETNQAKAKIAILPASLLEKSAVAYLQNRLVSVWGKLAAPNSEQTTDALLSGVNGLVTDSPEQAYEFLAKLPENTLLRKPLIIGHRGVPSLVAENTLAGALKAAELGADAVESDIYLTKDNHIVVIHDSTLDRTTDGTGPVEDKTLDELKALTVEGAHAIPTLDEFFTALKEKKVVHFIEIKSGNLEIVEHLKQAIDRNDVWDQVIVISFNSDQLLKLQEVMPGVSGGFLAVFVTDSNMTKNLRQILKATQLYSSTFNPYYKYLSPSVMEASKHRGTTFWPWTFRDQSEAESYYVAGTHGLTTDYAQWFTDYPVSIDPVASDISVASNAGVTAAVTLTSQLGVTETIETNRFIVLASTADYTNDSASLKFTGPGTATVLPVYEYTLDNGATYRVIGARLAVTIN
ncbi:glycerophosphodiester phosphodiesterase family protein [Marinobacter sp. F3R08]|uniref:glycerophosphodiester phosphodiesterase family protein n=1 Tax=Marinobacter sp. F3R08 TaxID=2841559 RepID=UPI001C095753|nr:glycerophosphodiester phosphodiesterase family protein [Marinobacter sp. F3R08]MBU2955563.1 DUF1080 domain-containing protein [Marinobacter sp. F3R08]